MTVGICKLRISMKGMASLKDKRMIVKSVIDKVKSRFNVSIAEVGLNDSHNDAIIGYSCVSNSGQHTDSMINTVLNFIENDFRFEVCDVSTEVIHVE